MVTTKLNLSMTEPSVRQIYAKQGDTGRVLDITLDQTPEDGTLRILRPDGVEVTSEANLASDTYNVQTTPYYSGETTDLGMVMGAIEGKSEQFVLPSGYQAIEYIQSTGHEYINTGFVPTSDDGFEIDFISNNDFSGSGNYGCILGARTSSMTLDFQLTTWSAGTNGTLRWGTGFQYGGGLLDKGTRQKAKLYQKTYTAPDGSTYSFTPSYMGEYPLYVFSLNQTGSATQSASVILYSLKLYRSADLAMYLIPCKRTSDNKLGLYDVVGGTFLPVVNIESSANPQGGGNVTLPNPTNPFPVASFSTTEFVSDGKNLITGFPSITQYGVTFTANADGSVTANGTATGGAATCLISASRPIFASFLGKEVILSGCPSGGSASTYRLQWWKYAVNSGGGTITASDYGDGTTPFIPTETSGNIAICINNGTTVNNVTFKPMIRLASVTDDTYVPYQSPSTASVSLTLRSLPDGTCDTYENGVVTRRVGVHYITSSDSGTLQTGTYGNRVAIKMPDMEDVSSSKRKNTICNIATPDTGALASTAWVVGQCLLYDSFAGNPAFFVIVDSAYANLSSALSYLESIGAYFYYPLAAPTTETVTIPTLVTYENYTYVHNDSEVDPTSIEYKAFMLESGQVAIPSEATEIVGKCYCDVEQNGVSSMPFTLNVKKNERAT